MNAPNIAPTPPPLSVLDAASFFLDADTSRLEPDVTPPKLQRLLLIAQARHLAAMGERLFDADAVLMERGPGFWEIHRLFSSLQIIAVDPNAPRLPAAAPLPEPAQYFLSEIWREFGHLSASTLRQHPIISEWREDEPGNDPQIFLGLIDDFELGESAAATPDD